VARSADSTLNTFGCPFADRCSCRVKFRIAATAFQIKLEGQGEHTAESHVQDKVAKFLTIQQSSALEQMVSTNPKKPHLKDKILQCAAHLTGIAWQKRSHTKFFDDQKTYKRFYKLLVWCLRCSSTALATILQQKIVEWLRSNDEPRAADWFEEYWTGERGNYTLAHAEVGGTNNNCGVEGGWNGVKKEVCGTAGATSSLAVAAVYPSLLRFLNNKSKEQASYWRKDTKTRRKNGAMFTFPSLPVPTKEEWNHVESLRPNILERPARTARWAPTLLGEESMIITKSLKVLGNFIHFPWPCLISASLAGARR
jgi:hypothetical protein